MLLRQNFYTKRYAKNDKERITQLLGGELLIELPVMPPEKQMRNYGLKIKDQKFRYEQLPENFDLLDYDTQLQYAKEMYHLRHNGEWWLIKGQPIYVSGHAWFFFNFWILPEGCKPTFRMEAVDFYNAWEWAMYDEDCFGLIIIKSRQEGGTQKVSCGLYDDATRYNNVLIGMMSYDEKIARASFKKIVSGHNAMHKVFQPKTPKSNKVVKELEFTLPAVYNTEDKEANQWRGLESAINYRPNTLGQYDGENRMLWFFYDEFAKIHEINPYDQLNIMKPLLSEMNGMKIKGKAMLLSTVEDRKRANETQSRSIAYTEQLWADSLQSDKNSRARTKSGLYRYFRDCLHSAPVDEYGFHKKEEMKSFIEDEMAMYAKDKDWHNLSSFKRKYPLTINDALQVSAASCVMYPHLLEAKRSSIVLQKGNIDNPPKAIRGELDWDSTKLLEVKFRPDDNGRWWISQKPIEPNAKKTNNGIPSPKNGVYYSFGVDPVDIGSSAVSSPSQLSKLGFAVFRKFNPMVDNESNDVFMYTDDNGDLKCLNPEKMQTNRFVCTYLHRDDSPDEAFQSVLKTAVYYGVPAFIEKNRAYIFNLMNRSYKNYLAFRPKETLSANSNGKAALQRGITATVYTKELLTSRLQGYVFQWHELIEHLDLLDNLRRYTGKNLTDVDLTASAGYALMQSDDLRFSVEAQDRVGVWKDSLFTYHR